MPRDFFSSSCFKICCAELISLSSYSGINIEQDNSRLRPIDADLQIPDTSKFSNHTGWRPEIEFEKTMADLLDYWRFKIKNFGAHLER